MISLRRGDWRQRSTVTKIRIAEPSAGPTSKVAQRYCAASTIGRGGASKESRSTSATGFGSQPGG